MSFRGMIDKAAIKTYDGLGDYMDARTPYHAIVPGTLGALAASVDAANTHRAKKNGSNHPYASGLARTGAMGMTVAGGTALGMRHGRPLMERSWSHAKGLVM